MKASMAMTENSGPRPSNKKVLKKIYLKAGFDQIRAENLAAQETYDIEGEQDEDLNRGEMRIELNKTDEEQTIEPSEIC